MNRSTLNNVLIFAVGAAIGSAVTWKIVKTKYERLNAEDAEAVREFYDKKYKNKPANVEGGSEPCEEPREVEVAVAVDDKKEFEEDAAMDTYERLVRGEGYSAYHNIRSGKAEEEDDMVEPYVIDPEEFDSIGYTTVSLTYYPDGRLVDGYGDIIDDLADTVGEDFAEHIGDYESDAVHIRNDERQVDYEIIQVYA
jgi:hypothetical protein